MIPPMHLPDPFTGTPMPPKANVGATFGPALMPNNGSVHSIHITAVAREPTVPVTEVRAVAGQGLEADRYFSGDGTYSKTPGTGRQVTLIELETIEALDRDYKYRIEP